MVRSIIHEQKNKLRGARMDEAAGIFEHMITSPDFAEFLTLEAYDHLD
jgi:hypothetical protein